MTQKYLKFTPNHKMHENASDCMSDNVYAMPQPIASTFLQ